MRHPSHPSQALPDDPFSGAQADFAEATLPQSLAPLVDGEGGETQPDFLSFELPDTQSADLELDAVADVASVGVLHQALMAQWPQPVMALLVDRSPRLLFWNRAAEQALGYQAADLLGNPLGLTLLCPDPDYLARKLQELAPLGRQCSDFEWTFTCRNGQKRRFSWTSIPLPPASSGERIFWLTGADVSRRLATEQVLRGRDRLLRSVFRHLPDMVYLKDGQGRWLLTNPGSLAVLGLTEKDAIGKTNLELSNLGLPMAESLRLSALNEEATWQSGRVSHVQEMAVDLHGSQRSFDVVRVPTFGRDDERLHMLVIRRDVTDQRSAATKLELAGRVLDQSSDGILISDAQHEVMMANVAFCDITGYSSEELVGREVNLLADGQHDPGFKTHIWSEVNEQGRWAGEVWNRRKNGEVFPQWLTLSALRHRSSGEITHYVAAISDLSSSKAAEEKIAYLSTQDVVTGLPNRTQVALHAQAALERARANTDGMALLVVDIDNFKTLNDSLGHAAGDFLLREVGQRLAQFAGAQAVVGRLSGDEFVLLQSGIKGTADAAHLAQATMDAVAQPVVFEGLPVNVSISLGVALYPSDGDSFDALFGRADAAMYAAKRAGRGAYQFATASMNEAALERLQLEASLRLAIETGALRLEYQPLVELSSGRMIGVEALCRWDHPERGPIPPGVFIPLAEDSGLIESLGRWVLLTATQQLQRWHEAGHAELMMAVNLSARQFQRGVVLEQVEEALVVSGVNPARLELELTESVLLHDGEAVMNTLRQLKALGVTLSIDDFGTGYSSFAYLRRFKFDKIKIDQSFVRDVIDDPDDAAIVRGIISLALSLGLHVLAEGVETEAIAQRLRTLKCTYAQGYHFARPLRPEALAERFLQAPPALS
ncbi:EAL domain-containing protein [Curvibacter sp. HBC28]|uniref:EAL domain-containing protein n=1 Tax=Curvibacter microcysteis TaxID=3026419 RepID=A0ABT5ME38_9BURK|nr:EAL domain-containing protein [Curvibacter sp. HBC28]